MNYLLVTDIFGKTAHLTQLALQLRNRVRMCDPYMGQIQLPTNESAQYQHFLNECGHDTYFERVHFTLTTIKRPTTIIAFSAGASAAWRAQAELHNPFIKQLIAFYPSQVRHHLSLNANIPCRFIFPHSEAHFDIAPVVAALNEKDRVECSITEYAHGFMNALSENFDLNAYKYFTSHLLANETSSAQSIPN
ncbi:hypothetical protein [Pseudoalteromonas sp. L21]|uniref:hypothetical protein n=1 Tax=Pseudoalteromonas sp. L21 TaxID=1539746 RepID=UPI001F3F7080|nr:hypothetical protein [Pseudoalteromonas sp. L21]MCF7519328.1 hypothetical protein [Pseudoalteromonas sp. L21]